MRYEMDFYQILFAKQGFNSRLTWYDNLFASQLMNDGYARINSIKGNTIVWNQLHGDAVTYSIYGITFTWDNGKLTISGTATGEVYWSGATNPINWIKDHKYLVILNNSSYAGNRNFRFYTPVTYKNFDNNIEIWTATQTYTAQLKMYIASGQTVDTSFIPQIFDLTAMGLDSLTADQFRSLYPLNYYQYNAGELLSFNGSGIKTVGFNQFDEIFERGYINVNNGSLVDGTYVRSANFIPCMPNTQYYAYAPQLPSSFAMVFYDANKNYVGFLGTSAIRNSVYTTPSNAFYCKFYASEQTNIICINVSNTELNGTYAPYTTNTLELPIQEYFPQGMKSAGNVFDELTEKKAITRITQVDLGTLNWEEQSTRESGKFRFRAPMPSNAKMQASDTSNNITKCSKYDLLASGATYGNVEGYTVSIISGGMYVYIYDSSLATESESNFKQAMSGVMLNYELDTYEETDIDIDLTYMIVSGGTEQLLPINTDVPVTSPLSARVKYPNKTEDVYYTYRVVE